MPIKPVDPRFLHPQNIGTQNQMPVAFPSTSVPGMNVTETATGMRMKGSGPNYSGYLPVNDAGGSFATQNPLDSMIMQAPNN